MIYCLENKFGLKIVSLLGPEMLNTKLDLDVTPTDFVLSAITSSNAP